MQVKVRTAFEHLYDVVNVFFFLRFSSASLGSSCKPSRNWPPNVTSTSCYRRTAVEKGPPSSLPWAAARGSWMPRTSEEAPPLRPAAPPRPSPAAQPKQVSRWQPWLHFCARSAPPTARGVLKRIHTEDANICLYCQRVYCFHLCTFSSEACQ